MVVVCEERKKKIFSNEMQCKIDNLMQGVLKSEYVKQKKQIFILKQSKTFARAYGNSFK